MLRSLFTLTFILLPSLPATAATVYVPDNYPTIQDAVDSSSHGDTIIVRPGTYLENIDFLGKAISLQSELGPEITIIDGGSPSNPDYGSVVTFANGEGRDSVLDGFALVNGSGTINPLQHGGLSGGGIYCESAGPTIRNNIISNNRATGHYSGAGIFCNNSSARIANNVIHSNNASNIGGGLCCWQHCDVTVKNNLICNNVAGAQGGAIYYWRESPLLIANNTIYGNSVGHKGGGIYCETELAVISNSVFWNNYAPVGPGIYVYSSTSPAITHCDVEGGWPGTGNIDADPLFYDPCGLDGDPGNDYRLRQSPCQPEHSPCVDAGDPSSGTLKGSTRTDGNSDIWPADMGYHYVAEQQGPEPMGAADSIPVDWKDLADKRIEQIRKREVCITVLDSNDVPIPDVVVQIDQRRHRFAFGTAVQYSPLMYNDNYRAFFIDNVPSPFKFEWVAFENESKWENNEASQGNVSYMQADQMAAFCKANGVLMRGHCLFWADPDHVQDWVKALDDLGLEDAINDRIQSAATHFAGSFLHWDVNNEMLHHSYYMGRLGAWIRPYMFRQTLAFDPGVKLFVNDFDVAQRPEDYTEEYVQQINGLRKDWGKEGAVIHGIGTQCHFQYKETPDPWTIWRRLDMLAKVELDAENVGIWCTEFNVVDPDDEGLADKLERFYWAAFSHPAVEGIIMWGFWAGAHWKEHAAIVNLDWSLNAAGRRYEELMNVYFSTHETASTNSEGIYAVRAFYGEYTLVLTPPGGSTNQYSFTLEPGSGPLYLTYIL